MTRASRLAPSTIAAFAAAVIALGLALASWPRARPAPADRFVLFAGHHAAGVIVLPAGATVEQREAAQLLQATLAEAAGLPAGHFRILTEDRAMHQAGQRRIVIGGAAGPSGTVKADPLRRGVGYRVSSRQLELFADHPEDAVMAATWFLERVVGARWFMPGELGHEVPRRAELALATGEHRHEPGYISRRLGALDSPKEKFWYRFNRLESHFSHSHTAHRVITAEAVTADPRMAPLINGRKLVPRPGTQSWQPDLTSPATVDLAVKVLAQELRENPEKLTAVFGQNDSWRWDQSAATLAVIAPHQHFRRYPDYSNTLFAFLNEVAARLAPEFPDRFLSTYAYQWTENVPRFPVHPMVLPYLTADRSQWFDPDYAAEDMELMRRWGQAGPRFFALYDYYYGDPFFVPRPTLYAVTRPIPYAHSVGARGFTAECFPNWGLDGPKLWLAAQLLWDPQRDPAALLDDYYANFWREAAAPMRAFFERCDRQYLEQPKPAYWLRYFREDHQRLLFPPSVRAELRELLAEAARDARTPRVRERVEFVRRSFAVTELFCAHDESREKLTRLLMAGSATRTDEIRAALADYEVRRATLRRELAQLKRDLPLALRVDFITQYASEDPRAGALLALARRGESAPLGRDARTTLFADRPPTPTEFRRPGREVLRDARFTEIRSHEGHPFTLVDWTVEGGAWLGRSEPYQTLSRSFVPLADGARALRVTGGNQESLYQTNWAKPGALYQARVNLKAKVSPGNVTFLILYCSDREGRHLKSLITQRLPVGDWSDGTTLEVVLRAPPDAHTVSLGLVSNWHVNDDFAEWSHPSVLEIAP